MCKLRVTAGEVVRPMPTAATMSPAIASCTSSARTFPGRRSRNRYAPTSIPTVNNSTAQNVGTLVGGGVGLGFGNQYKNFPGGEEGFCYFLSSGNARRPGGPEMAAKVKPFMTRESHDNFLNGERYVQNPQLVEKFIRDLPLTDIPKPFVVFQPLSDVDQDGEKPQTVIFFVNPDQLSALTVLANYGREGNENVIIPYAAGCQAIGIYPYREAGLKNPRAVVGLTDLSARVYVRKQLGESHLMTFSVPFNLYDEMEQNVPGSFLERHTWQSLLSENR